MKALETKYRQLEEELLKSRRATQEKMTEFMEEEVGGQLTDVINQRMKIEARIRHNHQVGRITLRTNVPPEQIKPDFCHLRIGKSVL